MTDSEAHRLRVFYFRKPVWARLTVHATRTLGNYSPISPSAAFDLLRRRKLGFGRVRFVPKAGGLRAIVNLHKPQQLPARPRVRSRPYDESRSRRSSGKGRRSQGRYCEAGPKTKDEVGGQGAGVGQGG